MYRETAMLLCQLILFLLIELCRLNVNLKEKNFSVHSVAKHLLMCDETTTFNIQQIEIVFFAARARVSSSKLQKVNSDRSFQSLENLPLAKNNINRKKRTDEEKKTNERLYLFCIYYLCCI